MLIRHSDASLTHSHDVRGIGGKIFVLGHVYNTISLTWEPATAGGAGGSVSVTNFPATYPVTDNGGSLTVDGVFWPATQPVSGTFWQATQPVSGTFWQATQPVSGPLTDAQLRATPVPVSGTFWQATQPVSGTFWQATQPVSGTFWQATQPVSIAGTVTTKEARPATSAVTSVADSAANQTLLASNVNRLGASVHNDSTQALYLKLGATASATSFTVKIAANGYYEVPFGYTGIIDGIWVADAAGSARITEIT